MCWLWENSLRKWPPSGKIGWIFHHVVMYTRERESEYVIENFITNSIVFKLNFDSTEFNSTIHLFFVVIEDAASIFFLHTFFFDNFPSLFLYLPNDRGMAPVATETIFTPQKNICNNFTHALFRSYHKRSHSRTSKNDKLI